MNSPEFIDSTPIDGIEPTSESSLDSAVARLQSQYGDSIRLVAKAQNSPTNTRPINSIVFTIQNWRQLTDALAQNQPPENAYVLAILDQSNRVNLTLLEQAVISHSNLVDGDERHNILTLAPASQLPDVCGFAPGSVPPLALSPPPLLTLIDRNIAQNSDGSKLWLAGGGGVPEKSLLLTPEALLEASVNPKIANFLELESDPITESSEELRSEVLLTHEKEFYQKPFFAVAPPNTNIANLIVENESKETIQPEWVVVVGRLSGVRQMARRLVFADLGPPVLSKQKTSVEDLYPWRSPRSGQDMAVQLIFGKTICQQLGVDEGEILLRRLKVGQLVLIQGKTNVGNRDSLKNWIRKTSLDIVVFDCQLVQTEAEGNVWGAPYYTRPLQPNMANSAKRADLRRDATSDDSGLPELKLQDVYPDKTFDEVVVEVCDFSVIQSFHSDLRRWVQENPNRVALVGIDCEWKPNFLAVGAAQPVLLLQICFHPLGRIYLFDLQTLLRPFLPLSETLSENENAFDEAMRFLYRTECLVKVGFQVNNDFQRLAASYPQVTSLSQISSVMEISKLGMKVMQMTKQPRSRLAMSSLSKMTEQFILRSLNKSEQVSDWSIRPLLKEQMVYAALDAAVTAKIAETIMEAGTVHLKCLPLRLERFANDLAFKDVFVTYRYIILSSTETMAIRKWKAKNVVGDSFCVCQAWITGEKEPDLPTIPSDDSNLSFVDLSGARRVPSHAVNIRSETKEDIILSLLGTWTAKSKDRCVGQLLQGSPDLTIDGEECKLDFSQRSGFVELANAVVLFVTLPTRDGHGHSRSYPNEWMEEGSIMSWFIKEHEWKRGQTRLAQKMTAAKENENVVILFARRGKGAFFCCGRCRVVALDDKEDNGTSSDQWSILKLYLLLMDYSKLQSNEDFQSLVNPGKMNRR